MNRKVWLIFAHNAKKLISKILCYFFQVKPCVSVLSLGKHGKKKYVDSRSVYEFSNPFRLYYSAVHRGLNFSNFLSPIIYDLFNFNFGYHSRKKAKIYEKRKKVLAAWHFELNFNQRRSKPKRCPWYDNS